MNETFVMLGVLICCLVITYATCFGIHITWQEVDKEIKNENNNFFVGFIHTSVKPPLLSLSYMLPKEYRLDMSRRPPII